MINGLGRPVAMSRLMPVAMGLLFVVLGNSLSRVQPTWFVGIRTPWTLSSDTVWRKTHRPGGVTVGNRGGGEVPAGVLSGAPGVGPPAPGAGGRAGGPGLHAHPRLGVGDDAEAREAGRVG